MKNASLVQQISGLSFFFLTQEAFMFRRTARVFACFAVAAAWMQGDGSAYGNDQFDYQKTADGANWGWLPEKDNPLGCVAQAGDTYDVRLLSNHDKRSELIIEIWADDHQAFRWVGHSHSVFRILGGRLYYADFHTSGSGGTIVAVDLATGRELWRKPLQAIGPVEHSAYHNTLNLDANDEVVSVYGQESMGRYFEIKSAATGETVGHKIFPPTTRPVP